MDFIQEAIEKSWYKFNPVLTVACIKVSDFLNKHTFSKNEYGFNKCWLWMQILHSIQVKHKIGLPYYWFKNGIVVDPETLMLVTRGIVKLKWEDDCEGCQIEKECPCVGSPHNNDYAEVEKKLKELLKQ